jgi:hypothetical protein
MYTSGSRLKVKYLSGADGSKVQRGLYDTLLQIDCYFSVAADGSQRCLPVGMSSIYFSDAACTQRMAYGTKGCAPPKYATFTVVTSACPSNMTHIATLGGQISPAKNYYFNGSICQDAGATVLGAFDYYSVGAEIPPSSFVAGTEMQEP